MFDFYSAYHIVPFDAATASRFDDLRRAKIHVGTADLKIAAVALLNDALLLTANRQDFKRVPGLRFANWLKIPTRNEIRKSSLGSEGLPA